jgi:hypothetical protein
MAGPGINQYRSQPAHHLPSAASPLLSQAAETASERKSCGQIWGSQCRVWIGPPDWAHTGHPSYNMMMRAATRWKTPPEILGSIASGRLNVRRELAANPNTPPAVIERLSQSSDGVTRHNVACNYTCSPDVLERLSQDDNFEVRGIVAHHPHCSPAVLERLLRDPMPSVQKAASSNPNLPRSVLAMWQLAG